MTATTMIIAVGCHRKAEAAFRFLHGVLRVDAGYVGWAPQQTLPDPLWSDPPELWRVQAVRLVVNLDVLPLRTLVDIMEILVEEQEESTAHPMCHRKLWAVPDQATRADLAAALAGQGHAGWLPWLFDSAGFVLAPEDLQDFYVRWPHSEHAQTVTLPCLKRLIARVPWQFDLEI